MPTIENKKQIKTALIDGDIICYSVGFAAMGDPVQNALHSTKVMLNRIINDSNSTDYKIFLTGKGNFRTKLAKIAPYKGTRKQEKPEHYEAIRDYMIEHWGAIEVHGIEADDALGIAQSLADEDTTVICTTDKDLNMIKGNHYNWRTGVSTYIEQHEADVWFMTQLMTGDTVDNIKGIPGIGKIKAAKVIDSATSMSDLYWKVLCLYEEQYEQPYKALMENANLLWIQRDHGQRWDSAWAETSE